MAVSERLQFDTSRAFDGVAGSYHASNEANPVLGAMRDRSLKELRRHLAPGAHVLELGCGPGTDTAVLVRAGFRVTAIDAAPAMIRQATRRMTVAGGAAADVRQLAIEDVDALAPATFDAAFSNFGPFNCVADLAAVARRLSDRLRPGGVFVASVIGRICPWEIGLYGARLQWRRATVRFATGFVPVPLAGETVWTRYYLPGEFERPFRKAAFTRVSLRALSLLAPPPYLDTFAARHPTVCAALHRADDVIGGLPLLRNGGDHFLLTLRRS